MNPGFFELIPYTKHPLLPADAAGKRPSQSAITNATAGDIPCVYPHADFKRLPQADERQTTVVARYDQHSDIHRRMDLSQDAE